MAKPTFEPVTPHIHRMELPFLRGRLSVNVFLVHDEGGHPPHEAQPAGLNHGGWILVDAGAPGFEAAVMEQALAATGGEKPVILLLTHGHIDHVAAAQTIRTQWRSLVAAGREELPYLLGSARYNRIEGQSMLHKLLQRSGPALMGRSIQVPLDEGRCVGDLMVIHVPGHAPGMVALVHRHDRALLAADSIVNWGGKLADPPAPFTYDPKLNRESQARLAGLDFDHLLPSHGTPILNTGRQALQGYVASRQSKKKA